MTINWNQVSYVYNVFDVNHRLVMKGKGNNQTLVQTENLPGGEHLVKMARKADIIADAAQIILKKDCKQFSGNFVIDEELHEERNAT